MRFVTDLGVVRGVGMQDIDANVIVVGGGLAGLSTAALLSRRGRRVRVLESGAQVGGLARARTRGGFVFNRGAHALYRGGAAESVFRELGVPLRGSAPSLAGVALRAGALHRLPATPWSMLTSGLLSWRGRVALASVFARLPRYTPSAHGEQSAAAWLMDTVSDVDARAFLAAMLRLSTYAGNLTAVSAEAALTMLQRATAHGVLYLDGGWQQLVDGLVRAAAESGVEIRARAPVATVEPGCVCLRDGTTMQAEHVVIATPPSAARTWLPRIPVHAAVVSCLDLALGRRPDGPGLAFDLDDPMYLSVHSDVAALAPEGGALVHLLHYQPSNDPGRTRASLEGLLDRVLPSWRESVVAEQFLPRITVTEGLVPPGTPMASRPGVTVPRMRNVWQVGDAIGAHGMLADAACGSAREVAEAITRARVPEAA